jgi:hypothetical protein
VSYKVASHEIRHVLVIKFDEPLDFQADSPYAGVRRTYRAETVVITYTDDRKPFWKMRGKQVKKDNSVSTQPAAEFSSHYGMDLAVVEQLEKIAQDEDPRRKQ